MWNLLQIGFLLVATVFVIVLYFVNYHSEIVPVIFLRLAKNGSFGYKGDGAEFMTKMEVPKSFYRHYYIFACTFGLANLVYTMLVYFWGFEVNEAYAKLLRVFHGNSTPPVSVLASTVALSLLTVQCIRRCYETYYLQVFSKSSRMNVNYYIFGLLHYFSLVIAIVGQAPLFCGAKDRAKILWTDSWTEAALVPSILTFFWAWRNQYQSNVILANLRNKKSGRTTTEEYKIPQGGLFESVSSPHRYCEVILYAVLLCILPTMTFFLIFVWVVGNQVSTSLQVHDWYKRTFKNYPVNRRAIFKGIL